MSDPSSESLLSPPAESDQPLSDAQPSGDGQHGSDPFIGRLISERYRILELIAQGGIGAVYVGEHVHMRKRVAIKLLLPEAAGEPQLIARFEREAVAGAHVSHRHVASATDFGQEPDGTHYLVLEYVKGRTLADEIQRHGSIEPGRALRIARELADALTAVHERGIIHRDIKPGNIMLSDDDVTKLVDFGLAKLSVDRLSTIDADDPVVASNRGLTVTGTVFGTVSYMPPEISLGMERLDTRSDLYALGVTLYEMLTGFPPFTGSSHAELFKAIVESAPIPVGERRPELKVPSQLDQLVLRLLEKDPDARYQSAGELLHAIDGVLAQVGSSVVGPAVPAPRRVQPTAPHGTPLRTIALNDDEIQLLEPAPVGSPAGPLLLQPESPPLLGPSWRGFTKVLSPLGRRIAPLSRGLSRWLARAVDRLGSHPLIRPLARRWGRFQRRLYRHPLLQGPWRKVILAAPVVALLALLVVWSATRPKEVEAVSFDLASTTSESAPALPDSVVTEIDGVDADGWTARLRQAAAFKLYGPGSDAFLALAKLAPARLAEPAVRTDALNVIVGIAYEENEQSDAVFAVLTNDLGPTGLELLYDIVRSKGGTKAHKRAVGLLRDPAVMGAAGPGLRVAFDLRMANCSRKRELFERAAREGDERVLTELKVLKYAQCSRKQDPCCFRNDQGLAAAIENLEQRLAR